MIKRVKISDLFERIPSYISDLFVGKEYPWEVLPDIKSYIDAIDKEGFVMLSEGVFVGKNVTIASTAVINPPCIIGSNTEIRPGAYIRGAVIIGENCVIGNSTELKNCVLFDNVQVPHYNYVGDSVLGNNTHMGAGAICSNVKADGKSVVIHGISEHMTGLRKVGAMLGDGADVGCGCVLNPGTVIGKRTSVYPLNALRGVYPEDCIVKSSDNIVKRK